MNLLAIFTAKEWRVALASFTAALVVAIPVAIALTAQESSSARQNAKVNAVTAHNNARANCEVSASSRPQANAKAFLDRTVLEVAQDYVDTLPAGARRQFDRQIDQAVQRERLAELANARQAGIKHPQLALPARAPRGLEDLLNVPQDYPFINCRRVIR